MYEFDREREVNVNVTLIINLSLIYIMNAEKLGYGGLALFEGAVAFNILMALLADEPYPATSEEEALLMGTIGIGGVGLLLALLGTILGRLDIKKDIGRAK